jgi:predicted ATP-dependent serine protease
MMQWIGACTMNVYELQQIKAERVDRLSSTWAELDWAYGHRGSWGLPKGKISLWAGESGIGKTRLVVELAKRLDQAGHTSLIFQGEVSPEQFAGEKMQGYTPKTHIWVSPAVAIDEQIQLIKELKPDVIVTDSVQQVEEYNNGRGAKDIVRRIREAIAYGGHVIFLSQMTVGGEPRGGTVLSHEVDITGSLHHWSALTPSIFMLIIRKNRFGKTKGEVVFGHWEWGVECQSEYRLKDDDWMADHPDDHSTWVPPAMPIEPKRSLISRLVNIASAYVTVRAEMRLAKSGGRKPWWL